MPPSYKLVLLGDSSVGKSSLVHRFTTNSFDPHLANTIGAAFISKTHSTNPDKQVNLEMWDTAGQERYKSLTPMYYRNAKAALVCFDLSSPESSFLRAQYWIDQLKLLGPPDILIYLIGNKKDLMDPDTNLLQVNEYIESNDVQLFTTSARLGEGIQELFDALVDNIPQSFFDEYEQAQSKQSDNVSILNMRKVSTNSCC